MSTQSITLALPPDVAAWLTAEWVMCKLQTGQPTLPFDTFVSCWLTYSIRIGNANEAKAQRHHGS